MATDDFDLDDLDFDDFGMGDELDFTGELKDDRKPVTKVRDGVLSGVKDIATDTNLLRRTVTEAMPEGYRQASYGIDETLAQGKNLYDTAVSEITPAINELRRTGRKILPKVERYLPNKTAERLKKWSEDEEETAEVNKQQLDEMTIQSNLAEIFQIKSEQDHEDSVRNETRDLLKEESDLKRHQQTLSGQEAAVGALNRLVGYQDRVTSSYQRKSLELQYRQFFVSRDHLEYSKAFFKDSLDRLSIISKNTGLPDNVKVRLSEVYDQMLKERLAGNIQERVGSFVEGYTDRLVSSVTNRLKESGAVARDILTNTNDALEAGEMVEDSGIDKTELGASTATTLVGGFGLEALARKIKPYMERNETVNSAVNRLQYLAENKDALIAETLNKPPEELGKYDEEGNETKLIDRLGNKLIRAISGLSPGGMNTGERLQKVDTLKTADEAVAFSRLTRQSIVEIIPGYLSRIHQELQMQRTGDDNVDRTVFNLDRQEFTTASQAAKDVAYRLMPTRQTEVIKDYLDKTVDTIDSEKVLSKEARAGLKQQLLEDSKNGLSFKSERYASERGITEDLPKEIKEEIVSLFRDTFITEEGKADTGVESTKKIRDAAYQIKSLQDNLPNIAKSVVEYLNVGGRDQLNDLGLLERNLDGSETVQTHQLWGSIKQAIENGESNVQAIPDDWSSPLFDTIFNRNAGVADSNGTSQITEGYNGPPSFNQQTEETEEAGGRRRGLVESIYDDTRIVNEVKSLHGTVSSILTHLMESGHAVDRNDKQRLADGDSAGMVGRRISRDDQDVDSDDVRSGGFLGNTFDGSLLQNAISSGLDKLTQTTEGIARLLKLQMERSQQKAQDENQKDSEVELVNNSIHEVIKAIMSRTESSQTDETNELLRGIMEAIESQSINGFSPDDDPEGGGGKKKGVKGILRRAGGIGLGGAKMLGNYYKNFYSVLGKGAFKVGKTGFGLANKLKDTVLSGKGKVQDVYVKGTSVPALLAKKMKAGAYRLKNGKVIKSMKDLKGLKEPVYDEDGNIIISVEDLEKGLTGPEGSNILGKAFGLVSSFYGGYYKGLFNVGKMAFNVGRKSLGMAKDFLMKKRDIYIPGERTPRLYVRVMEMGGYFDAKTGKTIRSIKDIVGDVVDIDGNVVLSAKDISKGLVDRAGKRITGMGTRLSSLKDKALDLGKGAVKLYGSYLKGLGKVAKGTLGLLTGKLPFKFGSGKGKGSSMDSIDPVMFEQFSQRNVSLLEEIRDILDKRLEKKRRVAGDLDGDGYREGGWRQKLLNRKKNQQSINKPSKGRNRKSLLKAGPLASLLGLGGGGDDDGGDTNVDLDFGGDGYDGYDGDDDDDRKKKKKGRGKGKRRGKGGKGRMLKRFGGKLLRFGKGFGGTALRLGAAALPMLAGAGSAIAAGTGALLAGAATVLASPVVLTGLAVAAVGVGAYFAYKHFSKKSLTPLDKYRMVQYGVDPKNEDDVKRVMWLESELKDKVSIDETNGQVSLKITEEDLKGYLKGFGVNEEDEQEVSVWYKWFGDRFRPVFLRHYVLHKQRMEPAEFGKLDKKLTPAEKQEYLNKATIKTTPQSNPFAVMTSPFKMGASLKSSADVRNYRQMAMDEIASKGGMEDKKEPTKKEGLQPTPKAPPMMDQMVNNPTALPPSAKPLNDMVTETVQDLQNQTTETDQPSMPEPPKVEKVANAIMGPVPKMVTDSEDTSEMDREGDVHQARVRQQVTASEMQNQAMNKQMAMSMSEVVNILRGSYDVQVGIKEELKSLNELMELVNKKEAERLEKERVEKFQESLEELQEKRKQQQQAAAASRPTQTSTRPTKKSPVNLGQ